MKNSKKKQIFLTLIAVLSLVLITVGVSYSLFTYSKTGVTDNIVKTGKINFLYTEVSGIGKGISLTDAFPISDEEGKLQTGEGKVFDFKITSTIEMNSSISYEVTARKKSDSTFDEDKVKLYLTEVNGTEQEILLDKYSNLTQTNTKVPDGVVEKTIYEGEVSANTNYEKNFRLRMWISNDTDFSDGSMNNKTFTITVNVYSTGKVLEQDKIAYKEAILNGTDPILKDNLVPVVISDTGVVTKADTTTAWYSYANKKWANSVILKDKSISYQDGEVISEDNIESYFVWIPRYRYKIFNKGTYTGSTSIGNSTQTIDIIFENKETTPSTGSTVGTYLTHPAFLAFDTNGLWVGKFETGYDGAASTAAAQVNSVDTSKIIIKPNVYSWRSITVGNMFKNSYDYQRNLDSHMMKNTEWGAVAYLQHSTYGSKSSVRINNNSSYITGYSGTSEPTLGYNGGTSINGNRVESTSLGIDGTYTVNYFNNNSIVSSTTGNYSGIYDMSGGAWEYVMGYTTGAESVGGASGITSLYSNFFSDSTYLKYWDKYTSTVNTNYNNRILGDATGEMGPFGSEKDPDNGTRNKSSWYKDYAYFANSSSPWFARGGHWSSGAEAGSFAFINDTGGTSISVSFRIVLAPIK